ncbi:hypothetical protein SLS53_001100 [Cytospora paraplurivora]|uniref:C2H2-type domain-containing protein n=1 Tax=Cytospora paraplurivora TaxID=2898453 RepID=A0AAN9UH82_9PEZI
MSAALHQRKANPDLKPGESNKRPSASPSKNPSEPTKVLDHVQSGSGPDDGSDPSPNALDVSSVQRENGPDIEADSDSDDEIMYETSDKNTGVDDAIAIDEVASQDNTSDDDTDSASDDETTDRPMSLPSGDAHSSSRQLFQPPAESDDEDEGTEEDDASSVSSSAQSSPAAEPTAALPSANIQHQMDYPSNILEMATSKRAYFIWEDETIAFKKSGGAIFPEGYQKCTEIPERPWICPVRSCRLVYKTYLGLGNHFKFTHKKAMFNDNMDGTLSLVGSYLQKNESGKSPPVVVSKRPLDPKEPPMIEPTIPIKNGNEKASSAPRTALLARSRDEERIAMAGPDTVTPESVRNAGSFAKAETGNSEKMWEYILPFLKVHKTIPKINWVRHVIHLPRVRDLKWNEERIKDHPYRDSHPRDITALILYITGVETPTPCSSCVEGKGPFLGCIMISPAASEEAKASVLACANCYYHCGQSQCSNNPENRRSRDSQLKKSYNLKLLSDKAAGRVAATTTSESRESSTKLRTPVPSATPSHQHHLKVLEPSEINNIEMASESRTYKVIHGKDGEMIQMHGALIPEKYDLDRTIPGYPWICPVRSCRMVFKRITNLGGHFASKHRGVLFNDNLDGTLSAVALYKKPISGNFCPGLIISRKPLNTTEPPMEKPRIPLYNAPKPVKVQKPTKLASLAINQPKKIIPYGDYLHRDDMHGDAKRLWDYMQPYMPRSLSTIRDPAVLNLFGLSRVRSLKWRKSWHQDPLLDNDWRQIAGLLIHLVGVENDNLDKCWRCGSRSEPPTSFVPPIAQWAAATATATPSSDGMMAIGSNTNSNKRSHSVMSDDEQEEQRALRRRSERIQVRPSVPEAKAEPARKLVTFPILSKEKQASVTGTSRGGSDTPVLHPGQTTPDGQLEMEEWEIAPGRIRETGVKKPNTFSKSYLETNQMVRISPEFSFRVETVKSGRTLEFDADRAKTRYCALASGKLRVTLEGQPEFTVGTHGVFIIKAGVKGWVQNRLYIDSILHVSAVEVEC